MVRTTQPRQPQWQMCAASTALAPVTCRGDDPPKNGGYTHVARVTVASTAVGRGAYWRSRRALRCGAAGSEPVFSRLSGRSLGPGARVACGANNDADQGSRNTAVDDPEDRRFRVGKRARYDPDY